ncbi:hypothetical protein K9L97_02190 [Candidatus Woesearchaeota archaeon]|nr:hypothetical protein [Candidatus Woesearchaeota archaeon]
MVKNHMKRLTMPKTWRILRKNTTFITRPKAAGHTQEMGISLNTFLKEMTNTTATTKETKYLLTKQEVQINGKRKRNHKQQVGFLDLITIPNTNKTYRIIIDKKGKLSAKEIQGDETKKTFAIIKNKTTNKNGKTQINTLSGMNILDNTEKINEYKTGDTLIIKLPEKKIESCIKREKGNLALIYTGKHAGKTGTIEEITDQHIKIKTKDETIQTKKSYIIMIGNKKPELTIEA